MKHSIQNKLFRIEVKEKGAELCSITSLCTNREFMWQADPNIWASHAPNLFPVIGSLHDDKIIYNGQHYPMTKHGFIRNNSDLKLLEKKTDKLSFILRSNEHTQKLYPFQFEFIIHFILKNNKLIVKHDITNIGDSDLFFSLGGHPAFACPVNADENYDDYYLEFEKEECLNTWNIVENGLIGEIGKQILNQSNRIDLHSELFSKDALIFKNPESTFVQLKSKCSNFALKVDFTGFPYLGLWAKPNAPFICIEPWIGIADSYNFSGEFSAKELIQCLKAKRSFTASYSIEISE